MTLIPLKLGQPPKPPTPVVPVINPPIKEIPLTPQKISQPETENIPEEHPQPEKQVEIPDL